MVLSKEIEEIQFFYQVSSTYPTIVTFNSKGIQVKQFKTSVFLNVTPKQLDVKSDKFAKVGEVELLFKQSSNS